jgi:flagellar basal body-associated protein FliL
MEEFKKNNLEDRDNSEEVSLPIRKEAKKRSLSQKLFLLLSYIVLALIVWMIAVWWTSNPERQLKMQQQKMEKDIEKTVVELSHIAILPKEEKPQMAILDKNVKKLAETQPFFADAIEGDKVLVYVKAGKAIIYRSSENKIVNIGPVGVESDSSRSQGAPTNSTPSTTPTTSEKAETKTGEGTSESSQKNASSSNSSRKATSSSSN